MSKRFDCLGKAKEDEPIFVLRANDPVAPATIRAWMSLRAIEGLDKPHEAERIAQADQVARDMEKWRRDNEKG